MARSKPPPGRRPASGCLLSVFAVLAPFCFRFEAASTGHSIPPIRTPRQKTPVENRAAYCGLFSNLTCLSRSPNRK